MDEGISNTRPSECNSSSYNINDEDDEEDEEPQPAKRRKRDSQLTRQTLVEVENNISQTSETFSNLLKEYAESVVKRTTMFPSTCFSMKYDCSFTSSARHRYFPHHLSHYRYTEAAMHGHAVGQS
jgi:hypothetical protein